jgi:NADH-quinone oxidoreductase subunit E
MSERDSDRIETLSTAEIQSIEQEVSQLPDRESAAVDALRIVQEHRGWISDDSLRAIARLLGMSPDALDSIATFYNLVHRKPVGRHVIMLCDSVSCYLMGCERVAQALSRHLGIRLGETTSDNRFTLLPIVCLGACDRAPVMMVDDQLAAKVTPANLSELLARFE